METCQQPLGENRASWSTVSGHTLPSPPQRSPSSGLPAALFPFVIPDTGLASDGAQRVPHSPQILTAGGQLTDFTTPRSFSLTPTPPQVHLPAAASRTGQTSVMVGPQGVGTRWGHELCLDQHCGNQTPQSHGPSHSGGLARLCTPDPGRPVKGSP